MKASAPLGASTSKAQVPSGKPAGTATAHTCIAALRRHRAFTAAKSGDPMAALALVRDMVKTAKVRELADAFPDAVIIPVLAVERTGVNMLPLALAEFMAHLTGWRVERDIVQVNRTNHTDADAVQRLLQPPRFTGIPVSGARYVIVDDVITTGSTVQALRLFLEGGGATVVAFHALAGSYSIVGGSSLQITLTEDTRHALEDKFGLAEITAFLRRYGIAKTPEDLTNCQARLLLRFRDLDAIRGRIAPQDRRQGLETHAPSPFPHLIAVSA